MNQESAWNLLVFRDATRVTPSAGLMQNLRKRIRAATAYGATADEVIGALICAGEVESALADAGAAGEPRFRRVTDCLAARLVDPRPEQTRLPVEFPDITLPDQLEISPQEGFAYYALHPADFGGLIRQLPLPDSAAVVGIRSIGATLSAVVLAALSSKGVCAERITVRPVGHPYQRQTYFSSSQLAWVSAHRDRGSRFFVADEGPGISGSSFLSVGDALVHAGISRDRIIFLCTRRPDPAQLKAPDAARRWPEFQATYLEDCRHPEGAYDDLGGGRWRNCLLPREYDWPAAWTSMERAKFLSADGCWMLKFEGLGQYGEAARDRARILAEAGFSPQAKGSEHGFTRHSFVLGHPLAACGLTKAVIEHMARYCAFRAHALWTQAPATGLATMVRHNIEQEFGDIEVSSNTWEQLMCSSPVIADACMMPHDWIACEDGRLLKVDATCHGDDHFFPGPTDIAWDLAGAIVEWRMQTPAAQFLLQEYRRISGDQHIVLRMSAYLLAYSVFRLGFCRMAAANTGDRQEYSRLQRACRSYHRLVQDQLAESGNSQPTRDAITTGGARI